MQHTVIAIDGPAASGKSSVSRALAQRLGFALVNTGVMYRAVTWHVLQSSVDPSDPNAVDELLERSKLECGLEKGESRFRINGADPGELLVSSHVNAAVSQVASLPCVRRRLVELQRACADQFPSVMEGRDIGTAVFPDTPHKYYIDASPEVRESRRAGQGLHDSVVQRDAMDSSRKDSPLMVAGDAEVIDSSHLSIHEVVSEILKRLQKKGVVPAVA
jgi:cytidylate kinase